mmetsp:Transcript_3888/g.5548  ORF Transcript_3888/g.5548 Transcript_3888/m.5548 type:complete len:271 (+) Transcript_3888:91-903(+)|eukprot:CAMPEP_0184479882 /NCGR_PEP_ID=MMETSP0113_2-20130426/1428_1 /TAXON_ID=91329 /ORGANISM="Norrisiella sphaerica, Strain BC52" /LENGTH=270 /DNA_ID=CAMNT_0026858045 /DNA_START=80 /DNA_END=892 /DNA_ORIENTATION=-
MSQELSEFQNALLGMTSGVIEVTALQPLNYWKNAAQQGLPLSLNPRYLYRGLGPNCVNMGSCTMLQFTFGGKIKNLITGGENRQLSIGEEMSAGLGAGMMSAVVGSPLELIMIQQQRKGQGLITTTMSLMNLNITRGFVGAAVREGLWTVGYLSIPPIVRNFIRTEFPDIFDSDDKARIPASLTGAFFACYLTQPFDTIKTCMQGDIERKTFGTFSQTFKKLYADAGIYAFYRGATFRYGRMVCAVFMLDKLRAVLGPLMFPSAYNKEIQ